MYRKDKFLVKCTFFTLVCADVWLAWSRIFYYLKILITSKCHSLSWVSYGTSKIAVTFASINTFILILIGTAFDCRKLKLLGKVEKLIFLIFFRKKWFFYGVLISLYFMKKWLKFSPMFFKELLQNIKNIYFWK